MTEFMGKAGLPLSALDNALKALAHDSQQGFVGQRGTDSIKLDDAYWNEVDRCFVDLGVPVRSSMNDHEVKKAL